MALNPDAWAAIRRAYEDGVESVAAIAKHSGVTSGSIYRKARLEGWTMRSRRRGGKSSSPTRARGAVGSGRSRGTQVERMSRNGENTRQGGGDRSVRDGMNAQQIADRLYRAIDAKLSLLEARLSAGGAETAADSERETRELSSMIRSFEKVTAFAAALRGRKHKASSTAGISASDAERMREEIAQRLERLSRERESAPESGAAE